MFITLITKCGTKLGLSTFKTPSKSYIETPSLPVTIWIGTKNLHYRAFQVFGVVLTLLVEPVLLFQCYRSIQSDHQKKKDMISVCLTFIATILFWLSIPYVWFFMRKPGPPRFIKCYESVLTLDKQLEGTDFIII